MHKLKLLQRITVIAGVAVFLFSVVTPFTEYVYAPLVQIPERSFSKVELWSLKCSGETFGFRHGRFEFWFFDYWLHFSDVSIICAILFIVQTLTLSMAFACLFTEKRLLGILPTLLCPASTALMIYIFIHLSQIPAFVWLNYREGYWLTYPSEALFIISALLKRKVLN